MPVERRLGRMRASRLSAVSIGNGPHIRHVGVASNLPTNKSSGAKGIPASRHALSFLSALG